MRGPIATILLVSLLLAAAVGCQAAERKLLIVVLDKVTWHDLLASDVQAPTLLRLAQEGAPGMMCVRAARGFGGEYATIGAGSRAASRTDPTTRVSVEANAFAATERIRGVPAATAFAARTGYDPAGNAIVHLGIGDLIRQNQDSPYPLQLGLLGGTLTRAGLRVACVGNADTADVRRRDAATIIMDERGLVPMGDVSGAMGRRDQSLTYEVTADTARLAAAVRSLSRVCDVIVLDTGETTRVESFAESMTPAALAIARRRAIEKSDRLLASVVASLPQPAWSVLVLTPSLRSPQHDEAFAALAPVIWWPQPIPRGGDRSSGRASRPTPRLLDSSTPLLTSPSTRRPGLVVNTDIAPSVLAHFGLPTPKQMVGRPFEFAASDGSALDRLRADLVRQDALEAARPQLTRALAILAAAALWLSALLLLIGEGVPNGLRTLARALLLLALAAPPAMLLVARHPAPAPVTIALVAGATLLLAFLAGWLGRWRAGYVLPCLLLVALLVYDLLKGQQMLWWSPLSYSPAAGARFYGLGNEYAGALFGATVITLAALLGENASGPARALFGMITLAIAVLIGMPAYGANLGMSLAAAVAGAIFFLYLWRRQVFWSDALGAVLFGAALVAVALALDYFRHGSETSHIGRLVAAVQQQGWQPFVAVASRKLDMNLMLVRTSQWSDVALAAIAVLGVAVAARPARLLAALQQRFWLTPAAISGAAGALAAFALNDSGVVAAALVLLYSVGSLAYVSLETPGEADS
ncbi:MAG: hypothetical protein ACE149_16170 [Armatimonadota bacterium]